MGRTQDASCVKTIQLERSRFHAQVNFVSCVNSNLLLAYLKNPHTVEAVLTTTLVSGQLYLQPPSQNPVYSTPIQTLYSYIPVSGRLHLRTPFSSPEDHPEGVRLQELPLYILYTNHTYP